MIEVYEDTVERLTLDIYYNDTLTDADSGVTVTIHDVNDPLYPDDTGYTPLVDGDTASKSGTGEYAYTIDSTITGSPTRLKVVWDFAVNGQAIEDIDWVDIVRPYAHIHEIKEEYPELANKTNQEIRSMERKVRTIINAFTGTHFSIEKNEKVIVNGSGDDEITLYKPIINIRKVVVGNEDITKMVERKPGDIWSIRKKRTIDDIDLKFSFFTNRFFKEHYEYIITADFGWEYVPNEINLAALLLIEFYFCNESRYHRYGVNEVRTISNTLKFEQNPVESTGHIEVDQILLNFMAPNMVMI